MKSKRTYTIAALMLFLAGMQFSFRHNTTPDSSVSKDDIRARYERPIPEWPQPDIDSGIVWQEFKALPEQDSTFFAAVRLPDVVLGKMLFFDPVLSGSNQISCSTCHNPQTSWADKLAVSIGHDHQGGKRNTISLLNVGERTTMFWDGRATTLEEQALSPIEAHDEMAMDAKRLPKKLYRIKAYRKLFKEAYGSEKVTFDRISMALASFQRTLRSRRSRFDLFLNGKHEQMTDDEIYGMHLFRTKARCMNCHNGQYLTDESFHNIGLTYYKRKYEDLGRYVITQNPDDVGKFRTPSLRDVMNTNPWMHNGLFDNITGIVNMYNSGIQMNTATAEQKAADPLHPVTDPILRKLNLDKDEIQAIVAFLQSVTATQYKMPRPEKLPRD